MEPRKKSVKVRLTPKKGDALTTLMDRNLANLEYMMYGYINFDKVKIIKATDNLIHMGEAMKKKLPVHFKSRRAEWNAYCENHEKFANEIQEAFKTDDYDKGAHLLYNLIRNCMTCHKMYKPGISSKLMSIEK
ncbi:MAG: hypothetical protein ACE5GM_11080 [bacterium]